MPVPNPLFRPASSLAAILAAATLVPACSMKAADKNGQQTAAISFGTDSGTDSNENGGADLGGNGSKTVSINVPGFSAKVTVPDLDLGGKDTDIDGIHLYPGTRMSGVNVLADAGDGSGGESKGKVEMAFAAPIPPDRLLGYYKSEAAKAGWKEEPAPAGSQFAASKTDGEGKLKHLTLNLTGGGPGTTGRFDIVGG